MEQSTEDASKCGKCLSSPQYYVSAEGSCVTTCEKGTANILTGICELPDGECSGKSFCSKRVFTSWVTVGMVSIDIILVFGLIYHIGMKIVGDSFAITASKSSPARALNYLEEERALTVPDTHRDHHRLNLTQPPAHVMPTDFHEGGELENEIKPKKLRKESFSEEKDEEESPMSLLGSRMHENVFKTFFICLVKKHSLLSPFTSQHPTISRGERMLLGVSTLLLLWSLITLIQDGEWIGEKYSPTLILGFILIRTYKIISECLLSSKICALKILGTVQMSVILVLAHVIIPLSISHLTDGEFNDFIGPTILAFFLELVVWEIFTTLI